MVLGIVCEYNPFHNGHLHLLREARAAAGEDAAVLCVMSGDFVQRGEAAVYGKFARAEAACRCGADLVVELPLPWCLSSAEGFARGAVGLLGALGADRLCFGSESGALAPLESLAELAADEDFLEAVKARLRAEPALSFAAARQAEAGLRLGDAAALLSGANDILAVEYLKAIRTLKLGLEPFAVPRRGAGHDAPEGEDGFLSASALRARLTRGESLGEAVPEAARAVYARERSAGRELSSPDALETALLARLRMLGEADFLALPDAADGLGRRLYRAVREQGSLEAIWEAARTKRYPLARARRLCLCAALGVRSGMAEGVPPYARVLAANAQGCALLRRAADAAAVPLLTKPAAVRTLGGEAEALFTLGADARDFYVLGFKGGENRRPGEDWRRGPFLLEND